MKNCKLFVGTGNAKQVKQLDTLIQDKGSKISDSMLYIANDEIQLILRLINEIIVSKPCKQVVHILSIKPIHSYQIYSIVPKAIYIVLTDTS